MDKNIEGTSEEYQYGSQDKSRSSSEEKDREKSQKLKAADHTDDTGDIDGPVQGKPQILQGTAEEIEEEMVLDTVSRKVHILGRVVKADSEGGGHGGVGRQVRECGITGEKGPSCDPVRIEHKESCNRGKDNGTDTVVDYVADRIVICGKGRTLAIFGGISLYVKGDIRCAKYRKDCKGYKDRKPFYQIRSAETVAYEKRYIVKGHGHGHETGDHSGGHYKEYR